MRKSSKSYKRISAIALIGSLLAANTGAANAQQNDLIWSFNQDNAARTASLSYAKPETDNVMVYATCGGQVPAGISHFTLAANYGSLSNGAATKIRFSGNGKEYEINGNVEIPASSEGLYGVKLTVRNNDPIWAVFDSNEALSYQVPGFSSNQLPLIGGQTAIRNFVEACRFLASGNQQTANNNNGNSNAGGLTEREAFDAAKGLNSPEAWQAFLRIYPTGFFAELAKGYLARTNNQPNNQPSNQSGNQTGGNSVSPTPTNLPYVNPGMDTTPWYNFNYEQDEGNASSYAAGVKARGVEFFAWCDSSRRMNFGMREANRGIYPNFEQRARQAANRKQPFVFSTYSGVTRSIPFDFYELNAELGLNARLSPNDPLITALMKDNSFLLDANPLGTTFQLKNSRVAICNVLNRCGAISSSCRRPTTQNSNAPIACSSRSVYVRGRGCVLKRYANPKPKTSNRGKCRSRSVYIEGRGCILKKYANGVKKNRCGRGRSILDGRCIKNSQRRSFCGPGYTPRGRKCVSNAQRTPRYQQGVYVTEPYCNRKGLIKEGNYCVEDD